MTRCTPSNEWSVWNAASPERLTDEYAVFSVWPTEQNRIAATHLMGVPDLEWEKVEGGKYFMS